MNTGTFLFSITVINVTFFKIKKSFETRFLRRFSDTYNNDDRNFTNYYYSGGGNHSIYRYGKNGFGLIRSKRGIFSIFTFYDAGFKDFYSDSF